MRHMKSYSLFARLVRKGQLVGYRFTRGFLKDYIDLSIEDVNRLFQKDDVPKIEKYEYAEASYFHAYIHPYDAPEATINFYGNYRREEVREIEVDENMQPLKTWEESLQILNAGEFEVRYPFKSVSCALQAATMLDALIYSTDFLDAFHVMAMNDIVIMPETKQGGRFGIHLGDGAIAFAEFNCSINPNHVSLDELTELYKLWAEKRGIKNTELLIKPGKTNYCLSLCVYNHVTDFSDSVVPISPVFPKFVGRRKADKVSSGNFADTREYYDYYTDDGYIYRINDKFNIADCGITDCGTQPVLARKSKKYYFDRMLVHNGKLYEMEIMRHPDWVKANLAWLVKEFMNGMETVFQKTPLEDLLDDDFFLLPKAASKNSKEGSLTLTKKVDFSIFPEESREELYQIISEEWSDAMCLWTTWETRSELKSSKAEVIFSEEAMEFKLNITLK